MKRSTPINGAVQNFVLTSLGARLLYHLHYPHLAKHLGERRMPNNVRRKLFLPNMGNNVYTTVKDCSEGTRNKPVDMRGRLYPLQPFPASGTLRFVATDILGPTLMTLNGIHFVLVLTDLYSNLMRSVPTSKTTASHFSSIIYE